MDEGEKQSAKLFPLPIKIQCDSSPSTLEVSKGSCKIPVHKKNSSVQPVLRVSEKDSLPFSRQIWPITCLSPFNNRAHVPRTQFLIQRCNELFKPSLGYAACVFHPTICSKESPDGLSSPKGEVESYSPELISGSISASRKFRPLVMAPSPTLSKPDPRSNSNKR